MATPDMQTLPESAEYPLPQQYNETYIQTLQDRSEGHEDFADEPSDYSDYGHRFAQLGKPFTTITAIIDHGLQYENCDSDDEADLNTDPRDAQLQGDWDILCRIIPGFRDQIIAMAEQRKLRSGVCTQVAKHILRGPKSVFAPAGYRRGGRRPNCEIVKMRKMTPHVLAYIAVQARFAISDAQEWHTINRNFNYVMFF
ncbi:hypothetical protein EWM64_g2834 [Hericium alpestre]|uniref:Uncharacterized protein n=1 Tax=Hericium alpestre TaxID=135208 RepID=A0A4Z0A2A6_9AGAM|nr:hypothetical protein EWM64_g2834 [Hericium alpestre]